MEGVQPRRVLSSASLGCVQHVTPGEGGPQAKLTAEPCSTLDHRTATRDLDWTRILKKSPAVKNVAVCSPSGRAARLQSVASRWPPCPRSSVPGRVWSRAVQRDLAPRGAPTGSSPRGRPEAVRPRGSFLRPVPLPPASCHRGGGRQTPRTPVSASRCAPGSPGCLPNRQGQCRAIGDPRCCRSSSPCPGHRRRHPRLETGVQKPVNTGGRVRENKRWSPVTSPGDMLADAHYTLSSTYHRFEIFQSES